MAKKLSEIQKEINKLHGENTLAALGDEAIDIERIPTGIIAVDQILGGGFPIGKMVEIYGTHGCLAADTHISYSIRKPDGSRQNAKGGSIERLYKRFHGIPISGKGSYQRPETIESEYYLASVNEFGAIVQNRIVDVFDSGVKSCFQVTTERGHKLTATADHRFWTGEDYVPLGSLTVGDTVMIHNNTRYRNDGKSGRREDRVYLYVKEHPVAGVKMVDGKYRYHRLARARAVVEAELNHLTLDEYITKLNAHNLSGLTFLDRTQIVHHKDEDPTNDVPENLVIMTKDEHDRHHAHERHNEFRFVAVPDQIASITAIGARHTYDIEMADPYHNFVAQGLVVHNSGKTGIAMQFVAEAQKHGKCVLIDLENAFDPYVAENSGIAVPDLWVAQPDTAEKTLEMINSLIAAEDVSAIIVDSVAGLTPRAELDGDIGDSHVGLIARILSQGMRVINSTYRQEQSKVIVVWINQVREKIGMMGYGPTTDSTGGRSLKFWCSTRLEVARTGAVKQGEDIIGHTVKVKSVKSRFAAPFQTASFDILYDSGISNESTLLDLAVAAGLVQKGGAWFTFTSTGEKVQGKPAALEVLRNDEALFNTLLEATRND